MDGGSQRNRLLDADDGARIHRPEHQFRAGRRSHLEAQHHNDLFETRAIKLALGEAAKSVKISSTKSMIGHLLGAAGGVEFITCVKSIQDNYIHQTIGLENEGEECDLNYMKGSGEKCTVKVALSNSLGFGGHNGTLAVKKYEK